MDLIVAVKLKEQTWADSDFRFCEINFVENLRQGILRKMISPKMSKMSGKLAIFWTKLNKK